MGSMTAVVSAAFILPGGWSIPMRCIADRTSPTMNLSGPKKQVPSAATRCVESVSPFGHQPPNGLVVRPAVSLILSPMCRDRMLQRRRAGRLPTRAAVADRMNHRFPSLQKWPRRLRSRIPPSKWNGSKAHINLPFTTPCGLRWMVCVWDAGRGPGEGVGVVVRGHRQHGVGWPGPGAVFLNSCATAENPYHALIIQTLWSSTFYTNWNFAKIDYRLVY